MRTHADIIKKTGVRDLLAILASSGFDLAEPTVHSWVRRPDAGGSIPASYWGALAAARVTTLDELAAYAEAREKSNPRRRAVKPSEQNRAGA